MDDPQGLRNRPAASQSQRSLRSQRAGQRVASAATWPGIALASLVLAGCGGGGGGSDGGDNGGGTEDPALSIAGAELAEGNAGTTSLLFTVTLSAESAGTVTVNYGTAAGTAQAGTDFLAASGIITFPPGQTARQVAVSINGDTTVEPDETFSVKLSAPVNATLATASATGTIRNDDVPVPPSLSISDAGVTEGDAGTSSLEFELTLSAASTSTVTVSYATAAGSAQPGTDFLAASGSIAFPPGQTTRRVAVTVNGDTVEESDETFQVTLTGAVNATLADAVATGSILDDDTPVNAEFGLDTRPANPTCVAPERPFNVTSVVTVDAFPTAPRVNQPTKILQAPGDPSRWFILEKTGLLKVLTIGNPATVATWLDLTDRVNAAGEGGLVGMAFHPDWPATREVYLSYTANGAPLTSRISRFVLDSVTQPVNVSEEILLTADQPADIHNNSDIDFGPDGHLYIGMGDGGDANDPFRKAQDTTTLLGKMLRIDVDGVPWPNPGYRIPADNPYAATKQKCGPGNNAASCPEIYAIGFRNPWRWSFDKPTGELWLGDVGQSSREEINLVERGGNYGWSCREGLIAGPYACSTPGLINPVTEYPHIGFTYSSVTGGYVYRGSTLPSLVGRYVFGDYGTGQIWALKADGEGGYTNEQLLDTTYGITAFAIGEDSELYFVDWNSGRIRRLAGSSSGSLETLPANLADTGCLDPDDATQPAAGLIPYAVNAPFWSDGAVKDRYFGLPDGQGVALSPSGDFDFPPGSVLMKTMKLGGRLIETRLFMRHPDGVWAGYTYEWNEAGTAATRVIGGKVRDVAGQAWIYPSDDQCLQCHTAAAGFTLGPTVSQLNGPFTYPTTNRIANQLATLEHINVFTEPLPGPPDTLPAMTNPADANAALDDRARAYLDTNCSQCHRPGGPTPSTMDLRATTPLAATNTCNLVPQLGNLGLANARLIAPGDAAHSIIVARAGRRDVNGMPPTGSSLVDTAGVALLTSWITGLTSCP